MCRINKNCAIALFDSGVGGVTIMKEISALLPNENLIYYADVLNCPYGGRSAQEIVALSCKVVDFLLTKGVKIIVVACNTATTNAISALRERYPFINFVGTEPAVKPAVKNSHSGVVGVLATRSTISSHQIELLSQRYGEGKVVLEQAGDGLVELVESGRENTPEAEELLRKYIDPMLKQGIDYLALGCTHYPFLLDTINKIIDGHGVTVINPAPAIARRVSDVLTTENLLSESDREGDVIFYSSTTNEKYRLKLEERYYNGRTSKKRQ